MNFWAELRRRHVIRIVLAYVIAAWLLVQVAVAIEAPLGLPGWFDTFVIVVLAIGFPIVAVLAWAFDITAEGVRRTPPATSEPASAPPATRPEPATAPINSPPPKPSDKPSIAVLPFVDMSPEHDQEYFADGLSEELLNQFARLKDLRVIGRTSSFAFKGKDADLRSIGEALGARHILEGSVRKAGAKLRVTAQLIDASDGSHLWSETYDRQLVDVFDIQDDIAGAVADALKVTLGVGQTTAEAGRTDDVETYDLYLRARASFNRSGPEDLRRAAALYEQALARDPDFSRARAGLVHTYAFSWNYFPEWRAETLPALERVVAEARTRAPDDWATHLASALQHMERYEWADAEAAFELAAARAPGVVAEVNENWMWLYLQLGRVEDALDILRTSMASDPLSANRSFLIQYGLFMLGRAAEAESEYQRSLDLPGADAREDIPQLALWRIWNDGDAALTAERFDDYLSRQTVPTPWIAGVRAVYEDADAALAVSRAAYDDSANQDPTRLHFIATYAAHYGDSELALAAMRPALVDMHGMLVLALWYPDMAGARRTSDFKALVRDIGLVDYWRETGNWGDFCRPLGPDDFECF